MDTETVESSLDGSLNSSSYSSTIREFMTLTSPSTQQQNQQPPAITAPINNDVTGMSDSVSFSLHPNIQQEQQDKIRNSGVFQKITNYLQMNGFSIHDLTLPADQLESLSWMIGLTLWLDEVLHAIMDQNHRLQKLQQHVISLTETNQSRFHRGGSDFQYEEMEKQLQRSKKKQESLQKKIEDYESSFNATTISHTQSSKNIHTNGNEQEKLRLLQTKVKSLETLLKESERKQKQKEIEYERLRQKLMDYTEKERKEQLKNSKILKKFEGKERILISYFQSAGFLDSSSLSTSSSTDITPEKESGGGNSKDKGMQEIVQLFFALDKQRKQLKTEKEELETSLDKINKTITMQQISHQQQQQAKYNKDPRVLNILPEDVDDQYTKEEKIKELQKANEELQEIIIQQKIDLDYQEKKLRLIRLEKEEDEKKTIQQQKELNQLKQTIDNLSIELKARPTIKQWNTKQREIADLEEVLHNTIVSRQESKELTSWKKYLSTKEQMNIDQKNHSLHLWLIESLPKSYLKDIMQSVCRELDVTDVSEVVHHIMKLKTVIRTVPRMEELLSNLSSYIFERNSQLNEILGMTSSSNENDLSLDSLLSILRRWWMIIQRCIELEDFRLTVLFELYRRQSLLHTTNNNKKNPLAGNEDIIRENWKSDRYGMKTWIQKDKEEIFTTLRDMIDFETEMITTSISSEDYQKYLQQRPDIVSNRTIHYLLSLFHIENSEEMLPVMNQFYLRHQEFVQFLEVMKKLLGKSKDTADSIILNEVMERIQYKK